MSRVLLNKMRQPLQVPTPLRGGWALSCCALYKTRPAMTSCAVLSLRATRMPGATVGLLHRSRPLWGSALPQHPPPSGHNANTAGGDGPRPFEPESQPIEHPGDVVAHEESPPLPAADAWRQHPRLHFQDKPYEQLLKIPWSESCAVPGQGTRFLSKDYVVVYDSPARLKVRQHVCRCVAALIDVDVPQAIIKTLADRVVITGVGGNGKSHNVMLLVKELRSKGHVVVYVHDVEKLLDKPWNVFLRELLFGLRAAALPVDDVLAAWATLLPHLDNGAVNATLVPMEKNRI